MPRNYKRRTERASWSADMKDPAITAIRSGRTTREVSKTFNIARSTLQKRLKNNNTSDSSLGRLLVFSKDQEEELAILLPLNVLLG